MVRNAAAQYKEWEKYAEYCFLREKGFRKEAFEFLNEFLADAEKWPNDDKINFVNFLLPYCETVQDADYGPLPFPLRERLIKPALEKWCGAETRNSAPFRWYGCFCGGGYEYINKALLINPKDDVARKVLLMWGTCGLDYAAHHLPEGYIGDVNEDMALIAELQDHIAKLADSGSRESWTKELAECSEMVNNYAAWKASGHPDLEKWGEENKKRVHSGIQRCYYEQDDGYGR